MKRVSIFIVLFIILLSKNTLAQNEVTGFVKNAITKEVLASVSIYIPDLKIGTITDLRGHYILKNLPSGSYLLQASLAGYGNHIEQILISRQGIGAHWYRRADRHQSRS